MYLSEKTGGFFDIYSFLSDKIHLNINTEGYYEIWHRWKRTNLLECVYISPHLWEIIDILLKENITYVFKFRIFINIIYTIIILTKH